MKKVLDMAPYAYLPYQSGGQKLIAQFLEYLGQVTALTVVSVETNDASLARNYTLLPILPNRASRYRDTSLTQKIASLVKQEGIQTIIWEHPYYAWLAFRVRRKTGVKTIFHTHNIEYQRFRSLGKWWWPLLKIYEKWCFKKADHLFFITPEEKQFAISNWGIDPGKCTDIPFGVPVKEYPADKQACREKVASLHGIAADEKILLFNGVLSYPPNLDALLAILQQVNPILQQQEGFRYRILVCGKGLPASLEGLSAYKAQQILYAGFVDDIELYFKAADVFLNPVQSGGGIKTKMVESIAYGTTVVATRSGAAGIVPETCGDKLVVVDDHNWNAFAAAVVRASASAAVTPDAYYNYYYWGNIVQRVLACT